MEIGLTVAVPDTGARAEVTVRAPAGTRLADVAAALLARVLPEQRTAALSTGSGHLPATAVLGSPPLVEGALLAVGDRPPPPPVVATLELRCTAGPDAGGVWPLPVGETVVGRARTADLPVDDPELSRVHFAVRVDDGRGEAVLHDLSSTNGTTVDGEPVSSAVPLPLGAVVRAGSSCFEVRPRTACPPPLTEAGDGLVRWNRPPRLQPPRSVVQVVVPAPPGERERSPFPVLAVVAPLVLGVVTWKVLGSATFLLFTLLSPVLVLGNVVAERRSGRRRTRRERALWAARHEVAVRTLREAVRDDERRRRASWPDPAEALVTAAGPGQRLWERRRGDDDLLDLRVGVADQRAVVDVDGDVAEAETTARSVPVTVPLREAGVLGVAGPRDAARALARWLVLQSAVWHSPRDLQIVTLAEPAAAQHWGWVRWLPHARPDAGQDCRVLLGLDAAQAAARVAELTATVEARRAERRAAAGGARSDERPVLLVVDGASALRAVPGLAALLVDGPEVGVHVVAVDSEPRLLPAECRATAVIAEGGSAQVDVRVRGRPDLVGATADLVPTERAEAVARALAPVRDEGGDRDAAHGLPAAVRWTDLVGLPLRGDASDAVAVLGRWRGSGCTTRAVLGQGPDGVFAVDLQHDGPHALVAGTTGAGKSELLQTLIASLGLENRPDELTFVLVDYKGGAAFGPCADLPHVVGLVTDLDGLLVQRALASLGAELTRREAVLAAAQVKDLDDHRRLVGTPGGPTEVLPRLVIVVDEFASLAAELPEFVRGLVGIAMRGRSLGVHLVLATQRPEGVVSADLRANANLRLCLAVTRDTESRDVLDSPVAATISRATPGRGYARTGHAELTPFQAGRVGGRRTVAATDQTPVVELVPTAELGSPLPRPACTAGDDDATDLSLLVRACADAAARLALPPPRSPWLPPLPPLLVRDALPTPPDPLSGRPGRVPPLAFGLLDLPAEQARRPLALDLDRSTHLLVVGAPRTGRTTVLRTLAGAVAAAASPDDVHLYALDPGGTGLAPLAGLPHTGASVGRDQPERCERVLAWLAAEVTRRLAVLGAAGHADVAEQREAAPPAERLPHLLLLLDGWEAFLTAFQDLDGGRVVELLFRLLREGPAAGLHVVLTGDRNALVGRVAALVEEKLLLRLADRGDYAAAGLPPRAVPDDLPPGRGLSVRSATLLAQVALLTGDPAGPAQVQALERLSRNAPPARPGTRPRRVEALPPCVSLHDLPTPANGSPSAPVLGVGGDELLPLTVDLAAHPPGLLVAGPPGSGRSTTLLTVAAGLRQTGLPLVPLAPRPSPLRALPGCLHDASDAGALRERLGGGPAVLLVDDAELLVDSPLAAVLEQTVRTARDTGTLIVAAGTTDDLVASYRGFTVDLRRSRVGVLLSPQGPGDGDLLGVRLSRAHTGAAVRPGRGLLVVRGTAEPLQVAQPGPGTG